ncbi:unnamed protein product [Paramecium pentaurelia]|uniref:Mitochondrial import receptor subunit TOM40 n=1 Tax=Paramecium pentaurelia TaxID=43138 RepID=A0A8S1RWH9_9CILI|nr:unnamed protein product [Paramecium pentaurelia]
MAAINKEQVDMDNPAFAQQDPHLKINDDEEMGLPPQFRNRYPRRPPLFDGLLNTVRAVTKKVEHIKGFKFEVAGGLSNNFHLAHSWMIPPSSKGKAPNPNPMKQPPVPSYTLAAQYLGGSLKTPFDQPTYIMTGRWDSTGKLEAAIIKKLNEMFNFRFSAFYLNSDPLNAQMHLDCDITGEDYVHSIKIGTGLYSFNMMQTIGNRLVLGYEMMTLTERNLSLMSYAMKFGINKKQNFYTQYVGAADQLILAYNHRLLDKAYFMSELEYSNQTGESRAILGYRQKFAISEVIVTVNSNMKFSSALTLQGFAYQLKLCAIADYKKDSYKFGYGIAMGQV